MTAPSTDRRFAVLTPATMTEEQRRVADGIVSGPRGGMRGPFNALLRSPDLAERAQKLGEFVRYRTSLPARLNELAILCTGRHWTAQYEWYAHARLAREAGLDPALIEAIAEGKRPGRLSREEAAVYEFCTELLETKEVSDTTFAQARDAFGEQGVIDLIGALGYYSLVSMILNVERHPLPENAVPLKKLG